MIRKNSLGPTKMVIGIVMIILGLFITLFAGIAFLFQSFGGLIDIGLVASGLIFMFVGIWMVLDAAFSDVQVKIENLDELATVMGMQVTKCKACQSLNPTTAAFCMRCGAKFNQPQA